MKTRRKRFIRRKIVKDNTYKAVKYNRHFGEEELFGDLLKKRPVKCPGTPNRRYGTFKTMKSA